MNKIKIVFQGDSITDAGRDRRNYHNMGKGYPKIASEIMAKEYPNIEFEFINQGISGNRTGQLFDRLYDDTIAFEPDIVSILIGINDIWHRYPPINIRTTDEQLELNYRCILQRLKNETNAKILMMQPYLLDAIDDKCLRADKERLKAIVDRLAAEYADVYIPLDELFADALKTQPCEHFYSKDGVHPNENGAAFIGKAYAEAIKPLIMSDK